MPRTKPCFALSLVIVVSVFQTSSAFAAVKEVGPGDDLEAAVNGLAPGDELVLRGGTYSLTNRFGAVIEGTQAMPIVIRAKAGEKPHVTRPNEDQNIIDFDKARFVTIRGIEFSGGSTGLRLRNASDVVIGLRDSRHRRRGDHRELRRNVRSNFAAA
jgi:hypothetical protein